MIAGPERFPVALRTYVSTGRSKNPSGSFARTDAGPSRWSLIFDTETTTDAAQRCRFGSYQVREHTKLHEQGLFYDPNVLKPKEQATLREYARSRNFEFRTIEDFIDEIFFGIGYDFLASIIGFNLPFDLSRIAIDCAPARSRIGQGGISMRGGFSFKLSRKFWRPRIQIKHHSRSLAFIRFASVSMPSRSERKRKRGAAVRRGYFLDLRTTGVALTGQLHSLESLADFLGVAQRKLKTEEHGKRLTRRYIDYAVGDVKATWACFVSLRKRFDGHQLRRTRLHTIYSQAGLGKAYLRELGIAPWRAMQPDFSQQLIGIIMSTYYGGRAEVHVRQVISQVLYCDFTSMYPTVCTLMRLWDFVTANGMTWRDTTIETLGFLEKVALSDLQRPEFWRQLHTLVRIQPEADIFPIRAQYTDEPKYTIGLNYLTSDFPMWFTLADCIAAKLLTGKSPKVLQAYTFCPGKLQTKLWPVNIMGNPDYHVDPSKDDFYRSLIDLRIAVRNQERKATGTDKAKLDAEQLALKILANATSYGIFVELNVEELPGRKTFQRFVATGKAESVSSDKIEEPGNYFHPLLGTLITGAARLMLATAETLVKQSDLDWAFCDTDSMAIAKSLEMADREFYKRAQSICDWFAPLN